MSGEKRTAEVDYEQLFHEFNTGTGPEYSIFEGQPMHALIQEGNNISRYYEKFTKSGESSDFFPFNWDSGVRERLKGGNRNMQQVFMGSYGLSFYKIGDRTLAFIVDQKYNDYFGHIGLPIYSRSQGRSYPIYDMDSFDGRDITFPKRVGTGYNPNDLRYSTTHQTYFFWIDQR